MPKKSIIVLVRYENLYVLLYKTLKGILISYIMSETLGESIFAMFVFLQR